MPWTHTHPMLERAAFIAAHESGLYAVAELADRFGVSRKTAYKWLARYREEGPDGLRDRSHAFLAHPHRTPPEVEALVVACRRAHPTWGPRKLRPYLARRHPEVAFPATSTTGAVLQRHGLVEAKRKRRKPIHPGRTPLVTSAPGEVWAADFKGQLKTGDGVYCYPLTVTDAHSRYVLCCQGLPSVGQGGVFPHFEPVFREHGLPVAIRTDNGGIVGDPPSPQTPSARSRSSPCGGSSSGSTTNRGGPPGAERGARADAPDAEGGDGAAARAGHGEPAGAVRPVAGGVQRGAPARGARRVHARLRPPARAALDAGGAARAGVPVALREAVGVDGIGHDPCGTYKWKRHQLFISHVLGHEWIGLEEVGDGLWSVHFYDRLLGRLDERDFKLYP